jgi:cytosine permease
MTGGGVADGIEGWRLPVVLAGGVLALGVLAAAQGLLGQRSGRQLLSLTADALGAKASRCTASLVILAMMLGWFALNTSVAGVALGRLLALPDRLGMVIFGALMLAVVVRGIDALSWSALAAGIATVALAIHGIATVADERTLTLVGDGHPAHPIGALAGVALVVGYGAAFSLRTPDFTHDLGRSREVIWCALVGLVIPVAAFTAAGAALLLATGTWNMADILRDLGSPTVAYLFVAVGFTGSVMTNLYSGSLSFGDAMPLGWAARLGPRRTYRLGLIVTGVVGSCLAALHFADWMPSYLTVMALSAPGLIVILWLHRLLGEHGARDWRPGALAAWALGFAAGLALHLAGSALALPAALVVTAVAWCLARRAGRGSFATGDRTALPGPR